MRCLEKCCCCVSLTIGTKTIAGLLLTTTLGVYTVYLARVQDVRDFLLDDLYGIAPCSLPPLDTLVDTCFQYSILANMLLLVVSRRCGLGWVLLPWLVAHLVLVAALLCLAALLLLRPPPHLPTSPPSHHGNQMLRLLGLVPLLLAALLLYCWLVVRSHYRKLGRTETEAGAPSCCRLKTGIQAVGGVLALVSGAALVLFFAVLDDVVSRHYYRLTGAELSRAQLTVMAGAIVLSILVNILLILGGTGSRWRRLLALPWLLSYGGLALCLLYTHLYLSSSCSLQGKVAGMVCLGLAAALLLLWSLVWMVAAQVADKQKTMISAPSDVAFQRL